MPSPFTPDTIPAAGFGTLVNYTEFTGSVNVLTTDVEATPVTVVTSGAITYAASRICIEFYARSVTLPAVASSAIILNLWDGATDLGRIFAFSCGTSAGGGVSTVYARRFLTPTAASHTYLVRAWSAGGGSGTKTVDAGAGGVGTNMPGFIRITLA